MSIEALLDGFEPLDQGSRWTLTVPNGKTETRQATLRVLRSPGAERPCRAVSMMLWPIRDSS